MGGLVKGAGTRGLIAALALAFSLFAPFVVYAGKWPGVDEAVVEKVAKEHGREAGRTLINTDQGDLLLFAFLAAGSVGGFVAGYYWRRLTEGGAGKDGRGH
jgi:hypothetical protein